jgi:hypothetical protein
MIRASGLLGGHAHFLHWGVVQISLANLIVIVLMLVVFVLAVVFRMPDSHADTQDSPGRDQPRPAQVRPHVRD